MTSGKTQELLDSLKGIVKKPRKNINKNLRCSPNILCCQSMARKLPTTLANSEKLLTKLLSILVQIRKKEGILIHQTIPKTKTQERFSILEPKRKLSQIKTFKFILGNRL